MTSVIGSAILGSEIGSTRRPLARKGGGDDKACVDPGGDDGCVYCGRRVGRSGNRKREKERRRHGIEGDRRSDGRRAESAPWRLRAMRFQLRRVLQGARQRETETAGRR